MTMTTPPQDQNIKITTRKGHVIEVSSEEELEKVARVLGIAAPSPSVPRPQTLDKLSPERSLVLLGKELLRRDKPINTAQVADLVGLRSAKGLAAQSRVWARVLEAHGPR